MKIKWVALQFSEVIYSNVCEIFSGLYNKMSLWSIFVNCGCPLNSGMIFCGHTVGSVRIWQNWFDTLICTLLSYWVSFGHSVRQTIRISYLLLLRLCLFFIFCIVQNLFNENISADLIVCRTLVRFLLPLLIETQKFPNLTWNLILMISMNLPLII